eukprot:11791768-Alexandrium_andersonii.AAC.1
MSASLVGSEMCIRDRKNPARRMEQPNKKPAGTQGHGKKGGGTGKRNNNCLLYTSDAADDM